MASVSCSYLLGAYRRELAQVELRCAHALLVRHEGRAVAARVEAHPYRRRMRPRDVDRLRGGTVDVAELQLGRRGGAAAQRTWLGLG